AASPIHHVPGRDLAHSGPLISTVIEAYAIHRCASMCRIGWVKTPSCCTPITDQALSPPEAEELAGDFKVLADPIRLRLLSIIASVPEGEICACDLIDPLDRSQATV